MSLRHLLLGLLESPASGYDLKKQFDQSLRNFWHAELSQIYPQLQKLEDEGFVSSRHEDSPSGPPRRVYRRSARGRRELLDWLRAGPEIGVASTKAFTTQLTALLLLVAALGRRHGLDAEGESGVHAGSAL